MHGHSGSRAGVPALQADGAQRAHEQHGAPGLAQERRQQGARPVEVPGLLRSRRHAKPLVLSIHFSASMWHITL